MNSREFVRIEKVEQIKQLSDIVVQWCTRQQETMHRIEFPQSGKDE